MSRITGSGRATIVERNFDLNNQDYFSIDQPFEVIDEPITLYLFFVGVIVLFFRKIIRAL